MTLLSLENDRFIARVDTCGAQLASLLDKTTDEEYFWQRDVSFWAESAPICFPIVGALNDGTYTHNGESYQINKHGCVRYKDFTAAQPGADSLILSLHADAETLTSYPFDFILTLSFTLTREGIRVGYEVINRDDEDMPFSLGYHPAFTLGEGRTLDDAHVEFSTLESTDLFGVTPKGFGLREANFLKATSLLDLSISSFDRDALVFKDVESQEFSLYVGDSKRLTLKSGGAPHVAFWAAPKAPYLCIEPWYFCPDEADAPSELTDKPGIMMLAPDAVFNSHYEVVIP